MRLFLLLAFLMATGCAQAPRSGPQDLAGTTWRLVKFQGGDGRVLTPIERSQYQFAFNTDGSFTALIDCNRGRGTWKSSGPGQLELSETMAMTRAMCPPGSMHDDVVKRLPAIRSYVIKDGHLFLSLMADGGTYELEPAK